ncbi:hypothetical protein [Rhodopseudomonas palustris]|uniref:hypothetical protein n=1 Tax=Rhodopseudomonas palustris TaxID=1076 RepID=UPI000642282F|nr:hypothetical protein [Rhodopseudomonas palustris]
MAASSNAPFFSWDWFTTDSSGFFTSIAAVVACLQAGLFVWQLIYMRKSMEHATISSEAAQESAKVAREAFTKMERPYIYILGAKGPTRDFSSMDEPVFMEYYVANYGKTPAKIRNVLYTVSVGISPSDPTPTSIWHPLLRKPTLIPGEIRDTIYKDLPEGMATEAYTAEDCPPGDLMSPNRRDGESFFFRVVVQYSGPFSEEHETSACWIWDDGSGTVVEHGGDTLNYLH